MIGHDLRTPMTAVIGYLELVADDPDVPQQARERVSVALDNAERVTRLSTEMLYTADGAAQPALAAHDVAGIVRAAVLSFEGIAERQGIEFECEAPDGLIAPVDATSIRRMLDNLISNAIKYSPDGGVVSVTASIEGTNVQISFVDHGIGISTEDIDHIFSRYYRAPDAQMRGIEGAGLGMPLVRLVIDAHGGDISVASAPGRGTTIVVTLPIQARTDIA
jgi:signal transduction histidine kinase